MADNPWGDGSNNPWGDNNNKPNKKSNTPPNIDDIVTILQNKFKGKSPINNSFLIGVFVCVAVAWWLSTGFYRVKTGEQGIVLQFGKYLKTTSSGLNYHLPYPIQDKIVVDMALNRNISVGKNHYLRDRFGDGLQMLTGDENLITIDFDIRWKISNAADYLFKVNDPQQTVGAVSESVMREVIGRNNIDDIVTQSRDIIENDVKQKVQKILDGYETGIRILQVAIKSAQHPKEVSKAFKDVQTALADKARLVEEAKAHANRILPQARGEAVEMLEKASGYKERVIAEAIGEASRFEKIYEEYSKAPEVTKKRIYLETVEKILSNKNKLILSKNANKSGVLPYLQLDNLNKKAGVTQ